MTGRWGPYTWPVASLTSSIYTCARYKSVINQNRKRGHVCRSMGVGTSPAQYGPHQLIIVNHEKKSTVRQVTRHKVIWLIRARTHTKEKPYQSLERNHNSHIQCEKEKRFFEIFGQKTWVLLTSYFDVFYQHVWKHSLWQPLAVSILILLVF